MLGELKEHPAWVVLKRVLEAKKQKQFEMFTRRLMSGEVIDQRQLDFLRGFWAGVDYLVANPENAERTFENAMQRAQALEGSEDS